MGGSTGSLFAFGGTFGNEILRLESFRLLFLLHFRSPLFLSLLPPPYSPSLLSFKDQPANPCLLSVYTNLTCASAVIIVHYLFFPCQSLLGQHGHHQCLGNGKLAGSKSA